MSVSRPRPARRLSRSPVSVPILPSSVQFAADPLKIPGQMRDVVASRAPVRVSFGVQVLQDGTESGPSSGSSVVPIPTFNSAQVQAADAAVERGRGGLVCSYRGRRGGVDGTRGRVRGRNITPNNDFPPGWDICAETEINLTLEKDFFVAAFTEKARMYSIFSVANLRREVALCVFPHGKAQYPFMFIHGFVTMCSIFLRFWSSTMPRDCQQRNH